MCAVCVCSGGMVIRSPVARSLTLALSNVVCKGSEENLVFCSHRGFNSSTCRRYDSDAGVRCGKYSSLPT